MDTLVTTPKPDRELTALRRAWLRALRLTVALLIVSGIVAALAAAWATSANVRNLRGVLFG